MTELNFLLRDFELEINQLKTEIVKLPTPLESKWVQILRKFDLGDEQDASLQKRTLLAYFDEVLTLLEENSEEHVLNYALSKLTSVKVSPKNCKIVQDFLFQCLMIDTSTFLRVLGLLQTIYPHVSSVGIKDFNYDAFRELLHHQIIHNCNLKRGHEVAWALWAMMYWRLTIDDDAAKMLSTMEDSIVALMALNANNMKLVPTGLDTSLWETHMNGDGLYGPQWLLAYEATVQGWLLSGRKADYVTNDSNFGFLKNSGVKFYDTGQVIGFDLSEVIQRNIARWGSYDSSEDEETDYSDMEYDSEFPDVPF